MAEHRKDAMLTKTDRKFLQAQGKGEKFYTGNNAKQRRYDRRENIRERIPNSLEDFGVLLEYLSERERKKIFGDYSKPYRDKFKDAETRDRVIDALAFLLRECGAAACMGRSRDLNNPLFKQTMLEALCRVGEKEGYLVKDFDHTSIDAERMPGKRLKRKLEEGYELSIEELRYLIEQEDMKDEIQDQLREQIINE